MGDRKRPRDVQARGAGGPIAIELKRMPMPETIRTARFTDLSCFRCGRVLPKREGASWIHSKYAAESGPGAFGEDVELSDEDRRLWKEAYARQERRLSHALRRLSEKGLLYRDPTELLDVMFSGGTGYEDAEFACRLIKYSVMTDVPSVEIQDEVWKAAIEFTMFERNKRLYFDQDALWGMELERHLDLLYPIVLVFHATGFGAYLYDKLSNFFDGSGMDTFMDMFLGAVRTNEQVRNDNSVLEAKVRELEKRVRTEREAAGRRASELDAAVLRRDRTIREQEREIAALRAMLEQEDGIPDGDAGPEPDDADEQEAAGEQYPELPETDVWFVGGYPSIVNQLRQAHPGWTFIDAGNDSFSIKAKCRAAFIWYDYVPHKIFWRVRSNLPKGAALCYVRSRNVGRLEAEMRRTYAEAAAKD